MQKNAEFAIDSTANIKAGVSPSKKMCYLVD